MTPDEARALTRRSRKIEGWFSDEAALLFAWIDDMQDRRGLTGHVFEIGCHHGKSTVLLDAMVARPEEQLSVCDLFGDQDENLSGSGCGDLEVFKRNLHRSQDSSALRILQCNSGELSADRIGTNYRFFHVDGGHDCAEALSDLKLAADVLSDEGLIALDDPFRPEWPGVTEAAIRFLDEHADFRALAVGFNKLFLVRERHAEGYLEQLRNEDERRARGLGLPWHVKEVAFHGRTLLVFHVPTYAPASGPALAASKFYHRHAWTKAPLLRPFVLAAKTLLGRR